MLAQTNHCRPNSAILFADLHNLGLKKSICSPKFSNLFNLLNYRQRTAEPAKNKVKMSFFGQKVGYSKPSSPAKETTNNLGQTSFLLRQLIEDSRSMLRLTEKAKVLLVMSEVQHWIESLSLRNFLFSANDSLPPENILIMAYSPLALRST